MTANEAVTVPMEITYPPAWLTWVAATTGCLRALRVECDHADVAGFSGYAFVMTVHEELCPSGPTVFAWKELLPGMAHLGRRAVAYHHPECHSEGHKSDSTREGCRMVFGAAEAEIRAGRPCVIWGTYVPEFGIAVGVEGDAYHVRSFKGAMGQPEPPIAFDEVQAPGGPYTLTFPEPVQRDPAAGDRFAISHALGILKAPSPDTKYATGLDAYDQWIAALEAGKLKADSASGFGNAYNAQC